MRKQHRTKNGKTREDTGEAADESQKQKKKVIDEAGKEGKTVHFGVVNGNLSSQEFGARTNISKIQRPKLYSEVTV